MTIYQIIAFTSGLVLGVALTALSAVTWLGYRYRRDIRRHDLFVSRPPPG